MAESRKRKLPSDFHDVEVGIKRPKISGQMNVPRKRKPPNDSYGTGSAKRLKSSGQEIALYPDDFFEGKLSDVVGRSVSDVEQKLSSSQVVKYNTTGDGNCFFHAVFGEKKGNSDTYRAERAQDMRMEWHKFLNQFTSLDDASMPAPLRAQLEIVFNIFLNKPGDLTGKSNRIRELVEQTNKKIEEADSKTKKLKEEIAKNFRDDGDFRKVIYPAIERAVHQRNERNIDSPRDQKTLLSVEDLLKEENKKRLYDDIAENFEFCALILDPNLSKKEYGNTYDPKVIKDSFFNDEVLYKAYLEAIKSQSYFIFIEEVNMLASLANIEINIYYKDNDNEERKKFEPDPQMINDDQLNQVFERENYKLNDKLWGSKEQETIYLEENHYSRAKTKEIQEQEDFQLTKKLQVDEILEYCNISKDSPARKEVEKRFDELLAQNANGKIDDVTKQCVKDIEQHMKRSGAPNLPSCGMEEPRVTSHQQQQIPVK